MHIRAYLAITIQFKPDESETYATHTSVYRVVMGKAVCGMWGE